MPLQGALAWRVDYWLLLLVHHDPPAWHCSEHLPVPWPQPPRQQQQLPPAGLLAGLPASHTRAAARHKGR